MTAMHREKFTCIEEVGNFPLKALTSRLEKRLKCVDYSQGEDNTNLNSGKSLESLESVDKKRIEFACSSKLSLNTKVIEKYTNFFFYSFVGTLVHLQVRKLNLCIT